MTDGLFDLVERVGHYRELAGAIRTRASSMKTAEARDELLALAEHYDTLARCVGSLQAYEA